MRTVENPAGEHGALEYQFGGAFGVLPPGLSEHPEDRADHLARKFSHFGVRRVATPEELAKGEAKREAIKRPLVPRKSKFAAKDPVPAIVTPVVVPPTPGTFAEPEPVVEAEAPSVPEEEPKPEPAKPEPEKVSKPKRATKAHK